jgi:hypothetical protein
VRCNDINYGLANNIFVYDSIRNYDNTCPEQLGHLEQYHTCSEHDSCSDQ